MKKSVKKIVDYLKRYEGLEIIRTKPAGEDRSYTADYPLVLVGFTSEGCIICRRGGFKAQYLGNEEFVLESCFTDRNWITYKKALKAKGNNLNEWRGKRIRRTCPISAIVSCSFMYGVAPTLISASKHHMLVMCEDIGLEGTKVILGPDFVNSKEWELAE